jgi:CDP-6-deoxy-D-xylo-4-hexulose-3-dehydrase
MMTWRLMDNNIPQGDLDALAEFIKGDPILTNGPQVREFEKKWSEWAQVKHSVYVNSGGTANLISLLVLREKLLEEGADPNNLGEVIVSTVNWVTDISSVMLCGFTPVFVDVDLKNVSMASQNIIDSIRMPHTKAVLLTHLMGFNALTDELLDTCEDFGVMLIEDCCESHGATHNGKRIGSYGDMSNYSFYYGHHITTIEGGMVCTNDDKLYQMLRMIRSHGLVRECTDDDMRNGYFDENPIPSPEFVFAYPGFNFRGTEIGAFLGSRQIDYLDNNIEIRRNNFGKFVELLDSNRFYTDFELEGNSNFGLLVILREEDEDLIGRISRRLIDDNVAFRRGIAGGGNQLRQPYLQGKGFGSSEDFKNADHIHHYGLYIGNHQYITEEDIVKITEILNNV